MGMGTGTGTRLRRVANPGNQPGESTMYRAFSLLLPAALVAALVAPRFAPRAASAAEPAPMPRAAPADAAAPGKLEYNRDIRPILAENCFACHGPDSAARK